MTEAGPDHRRPRSRLTLAILALLAVAGIAALLALGTWQVHRLAWKTDLIARVDQRVHAMPTPAPGPSDWAGITRDKDEYRRVTVSGEFLNDQAVLTQAVTDLGGGFWVITPLRTDDGIYLINRGFVLPDERTTYSRPAGPQTITGLLRMTEPGGGFLRSNKPDEDRWYSRDVAAIAATRGLDDVAPFFIDADRGEGTPVGGLTIIAFPNKHLGYAITWFALALGLIAATIFVGVHEWRLRRR
ncbi:SURF1 family protein [Falsirhodobacter halotolerans]|uniref:SURF1 family protein n=1 Tax=Falsirhodobacter halotolerans TaxID=1146892 RepID=UPI001FD087F7|nr:SURF1 family protein [Falsirhodobacter halotolerans]MCJ8138395.1 SURF1 family protein [Falsirhodobacter halotolerans]